MRVLLVAFHFPPFHVIGSVRPGKVAKYLHAFGHEVQVLSARGQALPETLPLEIPEELVVRTPWIDLGFPSRAARRVFGGGAGKPGTEGWEQGLRRGLRTAYRQSWRALLFPDPRVGWYPYAVAAGKRLAREWRPDVIYATAGPITPLYVARRLSTALGVPWVAEFRDPWVGNQNYGSVVPRWRRGWDLRAERGLVQSAAGIVAVSPVQGKMIATRHGREVEVIENGFDPEDFPREASYPADRRRLRLLYTGSVYEHGHDLGPLMGALGLLTPAEREALRVEFYGRNLHSVRAAAERGGVSDTVSTHDLVPYADSLRLQKEADLLLLLGWKEPSGSGVLHAKLYEYLGARRPVLAVGAEEDLAARAITSRGAGVFRNRPDEIAAYLRERLGEKQATGAVAFEPPPDLETFSRAHQVRRLAAYLEGVIA